GFTAAEVADRFSAALQNRVRFVEPPATSVEIVSYRPIYVLGDVERPGQHVFTPGLTAVQALALAGGGNERIAAQDSNARASINDAGNLLALNRDIARARAREARLRAEVQGTDVLQFPGDLSHPDGLPATAAMFEEEQAIFASRRSELARELTALEELRALLNSEIQVLEIKSTGLSEQVALVRRDTEGVASLVEQGLSRATNLTDARRNLINLESRELDLQNSIYRAQQRIKEADRDEAELVARRETQARVELQQVRARLEALEIRRNTVRQLSLLSGVEATLEVEIQIQTEYRITRLAGDGVTELSVGPNARLNPGDVLMIERQLMEIPAQ
ncbi:MAG: hypothetical protein AAFQ51_13525, partial [Pseudomonadota bacterium]